jgi:ABC transporter substrate binding protein
LNEAAAVHHASRRCRGWPIAARAQQAAKVYRIGFLANDPTIPTQPAGRAFLDGLRESGFVEGKNIIIERRFAEGRVDQYAQLMAELIQLRVDVIVTSANEATLAAKRATSKIPIVMLSVSGEGIVESLAHPGGRVGTMMGICRNRPRRTDFHRRISTSRLPGRSVSRPASDPRHRSQCSFRVIQGGASSITLLGGRPLVAVRGRRATAR